MNPKDYEEAKYTALYLGTSISCQYREVSGGMQLAEGVEWRWVWSAKIKKKILEFYCVRTKEDSCIPSPGESHRKSFVSLWVPRELIVLLQFCTRVAWRR